MAKRKRTARPPRDSAAGHAAAATAPPADDTEASSYHPGQQFGLPAAGPGSIASIRQRIVALLIDGALANVLALLVFGRLGWFNLLTLALLYAVFVPVIGRTPGMAVVGIHIAALDGKRVGLGRAIVRTALLCLYVPALVQDRDLRGMHDRAVNAAVLRA